MDNDGARAGALEIVRQLQAQGFRALWAGGCVRDMMMGQIPRDYDIATNADLEKVIGIFPNAQEVGVHFGVVVLRLGDYTYEVARFRRDLGYSDGRHPDGVVFVDEEEDARRRDFTINGMFYDPVAKVVLDYVGGQADLKKKVIRTIGDPRARFHEDRLRMLRAVRFACRYHWPIADQTFEAIRSLGNGIDVVSFERIRDEIVEILTEGGAPLGVGWLIRLGLMAHIMPEVVAMDGVPQPPQFHPEGDVLTHTLMMLGLARDPSPELAMGILLHDVGKPETFEVRDRIRFNNHDKVGRDMTEKICRRLRFSVEQTKHITALVADHHKFMHVQEMRSSTLVRFLRTDRFEDHLELHRVDCLSSHGKLDNFEFCKATLETLEPEHIRPDPLINGNDLITLGHSPGPMFSRVLRGVEDAQLEGQVVNRNQALLLAEQLFAQWFFVPDEMPEDAQVEEVAPAEQGAGEEGEEEGGPGYEPSSSMEVAIIYTQVPTIVVNPRGTEGLRFLSAEVHLGLSDQAVADHIDGTNQLSRINDRMVQLFTSKTIADVDPSEHEKLKEEIKAALNAFLGENAVLEVYFQSFVLQ